MIINNGIAEVIEYDDVKDGTLVFPEKVTEINAEIEQVKEMLVLVKSIVAVSAVSMGFKEEGRDIGSLAYCFPNLETVSAANLKELLINFSTCKKLYSVYLPKVEKICNGAFLHCRSLKHVNLPSCREIGKYAFEDSGLEVVNLSDNIDYIGNLAFSKTNISKIDVFGAKCSGSTFKRCNKLIYISVDCVTQISSNALNGCTGLVEIIAKKSGKTSLSKRRNPYIRTNYQYALTVGDKTYDCICTSGGAYLYADIMYPDGYAVYVLKNSGYAVFDNRTGMGYLADSTDKMKEIISRSEY